MAVLWAVHSVGQWAVGWADLWADKRAGRWAGEKVHWKAALLGV